MTVAQAMGGSFAAGCGIGFFSTFGFAAMMDALYNDKAPGWSSNTTLLSYFFSSIVIASFSMYPVIQGYTTWTLLFPLSWLLAAPLAYKLTIPKEKPVPYEGI